MVTTTNGKMTLIQKGMEAGIPIMLGYIPVAITYGVLAQQAGLSLFELTMMSVLVFAGASQFVGINMIATSATALEIIIATFVINFRHFIMSLSFSSQLRDVIRTKGRVILSLGLTDETFAVASFNRDQANKPHRFYYYVTVNLVSYLAWVLGSLAGGLLGEIIPDQLSQSMGIALYAMFIGLLVPAIKANKKLIFIALIAVIVNILAEQIVSSGWAIVLGTVIGGLAGVYFLKEKEA